MKKLLLTYFPLGPTPMNSIQINKKREEVKEEGKKQTKTNVHREKETRTNGMNENKVVSSKREEHPLNDF